jgi:uncharacterized protein (TIGR03435 family)
MTPRVIFQKSPAGSFIALACAASFVVVFVVAGYVRPVHAQNAAPQRFEAASIKPCPAEDQIPGPARGTAGGTNATFSPGRFHVPCVTAEQLIYLAYAGSGARDDEHLVNDGLGGPSDSSKIRGGPAWVHSYKDKWTIEATAASGVSERTVLMGAMLRTLLEDRFHLKLHRESEDVPMFALGVAKSGFKLKPMKPGDCDDDPNAPFDPNPAKPRCGGINTNFLGPNTVWTFGGFDLSSLAGRLSRTVGLHVIDKTGVTGEFIMRLEFHPDDNTPGITWPAERDADRSAPQAASIFAALEQQLGLKLEKTKAPRGFIVIDRIERPTPDSPAPISATPSRANRSR